MVKNEIEKYVVCRKEIPDDQDTLNYLSNDNKNGDE